MTRQTNRSEELHPLASFDSPDSRMQGSGAGGDNPWRRPPPYHNGRLYDNDERQQFLPPVKLDPGWEGTDRPPDELNFRTLERVEEMERHEPRDRFHLVYLIMVIHGVGMLMPWNMFINAKSYFEDYKLNQGNRTTEVQEYRTNFMSYIGMAAQYPSFIMNFINLFFQCGGKPSTRIVTSVIIMVFVFIVTVVLAMIDTSEWPAVFFWVTLGLAVILNSACGVYQNSLFGVAAIFPMKYTNALIFGTNFSGTFVASVNILTIALAPDIRTSAIYYFVTAIVVLLIVFDAYFVLPITRFFQHFKLLTKLKHKRATKGHQQTCCGRISVYCKVFKEIWVLALSIWFVFFVTLALFPQIQSDIKRLHIPISDLYWTPIFCFLSFNLFAMLGNFITEFVRFPGPRFVWLPVLLRALFIPVYLLCNFRPDNRAWPVLIKNDYPYIVASALMAFTSGYFSSLVMMYAPKKVAAQHAGTAGMMMALFLVLGILSGVNASRLLASLVQIEM